MRHDNQIIITSIVILIINITVLAVKDQVRVQRNRSSLYTAHCADRYIGLVLFEADFLLRIGFSNKDFPRKNYKADNYKSVKSKVNLQFGYQIFTSLDFKYGITQNLQFFNRLLV